MYQIVNMMNLVYMAKPIYGGWVTFTSHLALKYSCDLYKIGKRTEPNSREYGYGVKYRNLRIDELTTKENILITAVDKHYWKYLELFPKGTKIVIHDPTELKGKENKLKELLDNFAAAFPYRVDEFERIELNDSYWLNVTKYYLANDLY